MKIPLVLAAILSAAFLVACSGDADPAPAATEVATEVAAAPAAATAEATAEASAAEAGAEADDDHAAEADGGDGHAAADGGDDGHGHAGRRGRDRPHHRHRRRLALRVRHRSRRGPRRRGAEGRPAMTFAGGDAVVTDPANGRVVRVNLDTLSAVDEWDVGGAPASLAFVGLGGGGR